MQHIRPWWLALLLLAAPALAASPEQKCQGAKIQAFGKAVDARSQCQAEARAKEAPVDPVCLARAEAKLRDQFAKAEKSATCPGNVEDIVAVIAACVTSFDGAVSGHRSCVAAKIKAAAKKTSGFRTCQKKSLLKGADLDACTAKVEIKFAKAVAKAESKNACTGTAEELSAHVDACLAAIPPAILCDGGTHPTCDGTCPDGLTCRPYEVFNDGDSTETGCSCVDVLNGPSCDGDSCSTNQHCDDPSYVCERWMNDGASCDHMICQPAMSVPPPVSDGKITECDGGTYPTCGGTCADGLRCQAFVGYFGTEAFFTACACVDPRGPRCEFPDECSLLTMPGTHCADPAKACRIELAGEGDEPICVKAECVPPPDVVLPTTSTTTSSSTSTTSTSVTTTSSTIPCVSTPATSGKFQDLGNCTILDTSTGLQWEKKTDDIPGGLHDVEGRYPWSGCCDYDCSTVATHCQPDAAASATCMALADNGTEGCGMCVTGTCQTNFFDLGATTTVWGWINKVNADNFAGHSDWRLAKENGFNPGPNELETILLRPEPCNTGGAPCIDPIFGPTKPDIYWSATTKGATGPTRPSDAWFVDFVNGNYGDSGKWGPLWVRAVRDAGVPD